MLNGTAHPRHFSSSSSNLSSMMRGELTKLAKLTKLANVTVCPHRWKLFQKHYCNVYFNPNHDVFLHITKFFGEMHFGSWWRFAPHIIWGSAHWLLHLLFWSMVSWLSAHLLGNTPSHSSCLCCHDDGLFVTSGWAGTDLWWTHCGWTAAETHVTAL